MASESKGKSVIPAAPSAATRTADESAGVKTDRESQIAVAAYYKAEHRGFTEGYAIADWLAAEQEIDAHEANRSGHPVEARY